MRRILSDVGGQLDESSMNTGGRRAREKGQFGARTRGPGKGLV